MYPRHESVAVNHAHHVGRMTAAQRRTGFGSPVWTAAMAPPRLALTGAITAPAVSPAAKAAAVSSSARPVAAWRTILAI